MNYMYSWCREILRHPTVGKHMQNWPWVSVDVCYIVNYAKLYIWLFSILKTVQPEDLTNQTRVLESIERVLESLTEKTSNWKYKDMNIDSISEIADLNAPSSSHNIGHVEMYSSPLWSCQTDSLCSVYYSTFPTQRV